MTGRASDVALVVALVALAAAIGAALPWDDTVNDLMFVETVDDVGVPVVIVRVDEATEEAHSDPLVYWDRLFAHVVDGAAAGGADRVVLDFLLYSLPGTMDPDWGFPLVSSMAIARSRGVEVINIAMALGDGSSNEVEVKGPHPMIQSPTRARGGCSIASWAAPSRTRSPGCSPGRGRTAPRSTSATATWSGGGRGSPCRRSWSGRRAATSSG